MPYFKGPVNRSNVGSVLNQMHGVKDKNAALRIREEKGKVSVRTGSAGNIFQRFIIKKQTLARRTLNQQIDLVDFVNKACRDVGLPERLHNNHVSAVDGVAILSQVVEQYRETDRQAGVIDVVKNTICHKGKEDVLAAMMEQENDPAFLTRLRDQVADHALYDTYTDIIDDRIKSLSPDARTGESAGTVDSASGDSGVDSVIAGKQQASGQRSDLASGVVDEVDSVGKQQSDEKLSEEIFKNLDVFTASEIVPDQEVLELTPGRKKKFRYTADAKISKVPSETAVELPAAKGGNEKRFHGNYVRLHPDEPLTIATQSPRKAAQGDFWLANFKNEAKAIVDLTQIKDVTHKRADVYYPESPGETLTFKSGGETLKVSLLSQHDHPDNPDIKCSEYRVVDSHGTEKVISRVHFQGWIDHDGVEAAVLNQVIDTVDDIAGKDGTVTVHCSAGVGRTGTFITARTAKHQLAGQTMDAPRIKKEILNLGLEGRRQRNQAFIQKPDQMLTLVQFFKTLGTAGQHAASPAGKVRNAGNFPAATERLQALPSRPAGPSSRKPPTRSRVLTSEQFWQRYEKNATSESDDAWDRIAQDLKKVSPRNRDAILNKLDEMQLGTKAYLLQLLEEK